MPYISTKTNKIITKEREAAITKKLGEAITLIGKSESWLMLNFEDNCRMYFQGSNRESYAYLEIKLFGKATAEAYENMTAAVTNIYETELGIPGNGIYIKYEEVDHWGFDGKNF